MDIVDQISDMTIRLEQQTETRQEVYTLLLLAFLEIKKLRNEANDYRTKIKDRIAEAA